MKNEREKQEDQLNGQRAGNKLRELRLGNSMGLRAMARELDIDAPALSRIERGHVNDIRPTIRAYAEILIPGVREQDKFINETRLLGGYAPENMTPDKAVLISRILSIISVEAKPFETPAADFIDGVM